MPYLILKTLRRINEGDWVFYLDSGGFLYRRLDDLIKLAEDINQSIVAFELPLIEKQWCKKETFLEMEVSHECMEQNQVMATMFLAKKTDETMLFLRNTFACVKTLFFWMIL